MKNTLAAARITTNAENIEAPICMLASRLKLSVSRNTSAAMNSTTRKSSNMPATVKLRTPCRSSLMTMGFSSHPRQLAKWVLSFEYAAVIEVGDLENIQHPTSNIQHPMNLRRTAAANWMFVVGCWMLDVPKQVSLHSSFRDVHENV